MNYGSLKCPHCDVWSDKWKSVKRDTPKEMFDTYTCNCGGESVWFTGAPVLIRADEVDASVEWRVYEDKEGQMGRESLQTLGELIKELEDTGRTTANHFAYLVSELGGEPKTLDRIIVANRNDQRGITHTVMCYIIALLIKKNGGS